MLSLASSELSALPFDVGVTSAALGKRRDVGWAVACRMQLSVRVNSMFAERDLGETCDSTSVLCFLLCKSRNFGEIGPRNFGTVDKHVITPKYLCYDHRLLSWCRDNNHYSFVKVVFL